MEFLGHFVKTLLHNRQSNLHKKHEPTKPQTSRSRLQFENGTKDQPIIYNFIKNTKAVPAAIHNL